MIDTFWLTHYIIRPTLRAGARLTRRALMFLASLPVLWEFRHRPLGTHTERIRLLWQLTNIVVPHDPGEKSI